MAEITITLPNPVNTSLQAKISATAINTSNENDSGGWDIIYFVKIENGKQSGNIIQLGECIAVTTGATTYNVVVQTTGTELLPTANDFIFFGKNTQINTSGLLGHQATVKMKTTSGAKKELFAVNSEIFISSE